MAKSTQDWIQDLDSADKKIREEAVRALAYMGGEVVPPLLIALQEKRINFEGIAEALSQVGNPAIDPLTDLFTNHDPDLQVRVAHILSRIGDNRAAIPLIVALGDENADVRAAAAAALGNFTDVRARAPLLKSMTDENADVRAKVARSLGSYSGDEVIEALISALNDESIAVRRGAIWSLANFKQPHVKEALQNALRDNDREVSQLAAAAIRELEGDSLALERLEATSDDVTGEVRSIIKNYESSGENLDELRHSNPRVRAELVKALSEKSADYAVRVILPGLNDINPAVRETAIKSLRDLGDKAQPIIIEQLQHQGWYVRSGAAQALGMMGNRECIPALLNALNDDHETVKVKVIEALGNLSANEAVSPLREMYSGVSQKVQAQITTTLEQLGHRPPTENAVSRFFNKVFKKS